MYGRSKMYTGYPKNAQVHVWVTGVIRQAYLETTRLIGCLTPVGIMVNFCTVVVGRVATVRHHASATLMTADACTSGMHGWNGL